MLKYWDARLLENWNIEILENRAVGKLNTGMQEQWIMEILGYRNTGGILNNGIHKYWNRARANLAALRDTGTN